MTAFVIMVEKESYRYSMQIENKSKTNFKKYLNSNMIFCSRTHNYVGDNVVWKNITASTKPQFLIIYLPSKGVDNSRSVEMFQILKSIVGPERVLSPGLFRSRYKLKVEAELARLVESEVIHLDEISLVHKTTKHVCPDSKQNHPENLFSLLYK